MKTQYKQIIFSSIFALTLSACGGGGGGDDGAAGISYTGAKSAASLTTANGEEIATSAYENGGSGEGLGTIFSSRSEIEQAQQKITPKTASLAKSLVGAVNKIQLPANKVSNHRAVQSASGTLTGDCSGTAAYTITYDDVSGDFSGGFTFSNFCNEGETINGALTMSGNLNVNSQNFGTFSMTMTAMTVSSGGESYTIHGSMNVNQTSSPSVITVNLKLKDNNTQQVFWVENFNLSIVDMISYEELSMTGRFYHPDYGYVDVTTPTPFRYTGSNDYPYPGVLVATGADGGTCTLTSLSTTTYQIDIDEDGDGNLEQTTTGIWGS